MSEVGHVQVGFLQVLLKIFQISFFKVLLKINIYQCPNILQKQ